jgi:outer membrane murein-binding lipoprotein Lpp
MPTIQELQARITALTEKLAHKPRRRASDAKAAKDAAKARKAQFKLDAWRRSHSHWSINRYAR